MFVSDLTFKYYENLEQVDFHISRIFYAESNGEKELREVIDMKWEVDRQGDRKWRM